ncbi:hypothetical protein B9Z19DRAFT_204985 [Tuber borchii]|uniref:Fungal-specific transcription factor domain-domain-containing protein n=1 Tax=Tuber borchii TaxID=42251 RepID=A0A2T6ZN87_TUBBO|nr:hypothetical protein B9Z19DRAFT_204985 [Tuber borchii]
MDILVTRRSAYLNNEPQPPLDHIERVLKDLRKISSHGAIPYSAQLYCGIYEMPHQPGEYILLDWSPFRASSKLSFPLSPVDIGPLRGKILRQILGDIVSPLVSFDAGLRQIWSKKAEPQFPPPPALAETHFEKLDWLARICQIFLESSAVIEVNRQPKDSLLRNWDWGFWRGVLLEQMEFKSSYEQRLEVLCGIRSRLMTRGGKYHSLYPFLINDDTTQSRIESTLQMGTWDCVFSLLAQYQISLFLDYEDQWMSTLSELGNGIMGWENPSLEYGCGVVTLVHQFISETKAGDFPGRFCENIYSILDVMESVESSLNFYSPSIIALYEELTLSLIFLVRPYEFLVPESWHDLYFRRWERKYRSPSVLERFRYQQCLVKVCLSFCELVINIEGWHAKEITLARRSVILIVVCLINLGTTFPRPQEYAELWQKSQEVCFSP